MQEREEQLLIITFKRQMARHNRSYQVDCPKVSKLSNQHNHKIPKLQTGYFVYAQVPRFKHRCKEGVNTLNKSLQTDTNCKSESLDCKLQKTGRIQQNFQKKLTLFLYFFQCIHDQQLSEKDTSEKEYGVKEIFMT